MNLSKLKYYLSFYVKTSLIPRKILQVYENKCLALLRDSRERRYILERVKYYNQLSSRFTITPGEIKEDGYHITRSLPISDIGYQKVGSFYRYDLLAVSRFFDPRLWVSFTMGDVTFEPEVPSIVKSRPIAESGPCERSVILKLNQLRHFRFIRDRQSYEEKRNILMWRGSTCNKSHRLSFLQSFYSHPLCDVAQVKEPDSYAYGDVLSIEQQLRNKFILCIEGNDVATNLKWAMSSNSLCMMVKPKYETWFMEGLLQPGVHYVQLADDYSDLEQKIVYYSKHVDEAKEIIFNANRYIVQFQNQLREDLISILVFSKFLAHSGQIDFPYRNILDLERLEVL